MPLCDWEHTLSLEQKFKLKQVSQHKKQQTTTEIATATMVMFPGKYLYLKRWIQDGDKNCESRSLIARYSQEGFHLTSGSLPQWFCRSDRSTGTPYTYLEKGGGIEVTRQTGGKQTLNGRLNLLQVNTTLLPKYYYVNVTNSWKLQIIF